MVRKTKSAGTCSGRFRRSHETGKVSCEDRRWRSHETGARGKRSALSDVTNTPGRARKKAKAEAALLESAAAAPAPVQQANNSGDDSYSAPPPESLSKTLS